MSKKETKRISLWSGPRNISTALMYSFAQRTDTKVFDEPLYAYYLDNTDADEYHPSAQDILNTMDNCGENVIDMMLNNDENEVLFFKNMTHHLLDLDRGFLDGLINVILTRDPLEMLPSFAEVIPNPKMNDVGYKLHIDLVNELKSKDLPVIILDSKRILINPKKELMNLCDAIGIPFDESMLSWQAGARKEDGIWAKHWYRNVHQSTGFKAYNPKTKPFPKHLEPLLEECKVYYDQLMSFV